MEELLKAIARSNVAAQVLLLPKALAYGDSGINFLIDCLDDPELEIRFTAYQLLQGIESDTSQRAILSGFLLNPGDKIYHVLESDIYFEDSFYRLDPSVNIDKVKHLVTYDDYKDQGYKVISFGKVAYITVDTFTNCYFNFQQAKLKAESLRHKILLKRNITEFGFQKNRETVQQWCDRYQIIEEVNSFKLDASLEKRWSEQKYFLYIPNSDDYIYWFKVEQYLKSVQNSTLLSQLWQDLIGCVAGICKIIFYKPTYLGINDYYSPIKKCVKNLEYADDKGNLYSEEAEINLLITALNNPQLEIRTLAYQLLQGIDSEKAKQAIYQGVKLKPGDKIYSVYRSGIGFDDEMYYLHDDADYTEQIHCLIEGNYLENPDTYSRRVYCFIEKKEAQKATEILHHKFIEETNFGIELLSKFWKDGISHFAFFKEEVVQQTTYVRIGHKLDHKAGEDKLFAIPEECKAEASKLLIEILSNKEANKKSRAKAREILHQADWDEIPF